MARISDSKGFLSGRIWPLVVAVLIPASLVFIACLMVWYHIGGGAWRSGVSVIEVRLEAPDTLILSVASCHGAPTASVKEETTDAVHVEVVAFSTPLYGGRDCLDAVKAHLMEPLGDRVVVDTHSSEIFAGPLQPFAQASAKPQPNWKMVEVPGLQGQPGFSLPLPFGWELGKVQRGDAVVGEVIGDEDIRLTFHYGKGAWNLDPADDPKNDYFVTYEDIGGLEAKLLISINDSVFINETLPGYCEDRGIEFTRSRAYRKNDQAWIEQKNGSVVRRFVGHERYSGPMAGQTMAHLYGAMRLYVNHFQPSFQLLERTRDGGTVKKRYGMPATPCDRLLWRDDVSADTRAMLSDSRVELDPVSLLHTIREAQSRSPPSMRPTRRVCRKARAWNAS